jgi:hypothetical protein
MRGQRTSPRPNPPFAPWWEKGAGGMRGQRASPRPNPPFAPWWEKGAGGMMGANAPRYAAALSALAPPHAGQGDTLDEEAL